MRIALVVSQFNEFVTSRLESGARAALESRGLRGDDIGVSHVPGSFELAQAAQAEAATGKWSAVVCLGCLIRGETAHFDVIANATADGIMRAAQATGVPITFGVLTTNTAEEALARAGDGPTNKGWEAAIAAIEMADLFARLAS
jgi:6,7-dimethyl-8-ribityllumazine synthase